MSASERYGGTGAPEDMDLELRRQQRILDELGIEHRWMPEAAAPYLSDEFRSKLRAQLRGELTSEDEIEITRLIFRFRSVYRCWSAIRIEQALRGDDRSS